MKIALACSKIWNQEMAGNLQKRLTADVAVIQEPGGLTTDFLKSFSPDFVFFPHWSHLIPPEIYLHHKCIMFHMTDLPYGRGGSPLQNLIIRGHTETKMSAFACTEGLDAGPVYLKRSLSLEGAASEIYLRATDLIEDMIVEIASGNLQPVPQAGEPVMFQRRTPEQSEIPKDLSGVRLYDFIRMLDAVGYPPAFISYGGRRFEFTNARLEGGVVSASVKVKP